MINDLPCSRSGQEGAGAPPSQWTSLRPIRYLTHDGDPDAHYLWATSSGLEMVHPAEAGTLDRAAALAFAHGRLGEGDSADGWWLMPDGTWQLPIEVYTPDDGHDDLRSLLAVVEPAPARLA